MAERRMISCAIISSDAFRGMSLDAQALYFHMSCEADDDGFVNSALSIQRSIGATKEAVNELVANKFLISFPSGVYLIKHWLINNVIRQDRYHATNYVKEKALVEIETENKSYRLVDSWQPSDNQMTTTCQPTDNQMETEVRLGKVNRKERHINVSKEKSDLFSDTPKRKLFSKPTPEEVRAYCRERNNGVDADKFYNFYESKNWYVGKNKMVDWKAAVRTWEQKSPTLRRIETDPNERMRGVNSDGSLNLLGDL